LKRRGISAGIASPGCRLIRLANESIRRSRRAIENPVHKGYHLAALLTGCRPTELAMIRESDIDLAARRMIIRNAKAGNDSRYRSRARWLSRWRWLSLSQTPSGWRLIENRAMLLLNGGFVQTDLWNGDRPAAVTSCA
jgi:integrase